MVCLAYNFYFLNSVEYALLFTARFLQFDWCICKEIYGERGMIIKFRK